MKKFLCLVSDPLKFGRGHLSRQIQIQREFGELGFEYPIHFNKVEMDLSLLNQNTTLVLDLSNLDEEPTPEFLQQFDEVIGFDASGTYIPDWNFVVLAHPKRDYRASKYFSAGLHNMIVRSDLSALRSKKEQVERDFLLISLGYSASTNAYQQALALTKDLLNIPKILASGSELEIEPSEDLEVIVDSPNFIHLLATSKAVITNGGTTYVESLLLGKSVMSIPQTKDEQNFVDTIYPLTKHDVELPGFRKLNSEEASKAGLGTDGAKRLCQIMIEQL